MAPGDLRGRITDQFSYRGDRADVWRGFDLFLATDAFLNLGYSPRYLPHVVGSSQRRLAAKIGRRLAAHLPTTEGARLLDVGCGRGGPAIHLADRFGFRVTGVDLVPYNVARAVENARRRDVAADFVVGDATSLPLCSGAVAACTLVDALVYVPDRPAAVAGVADATRSGGVVVCSDLLTRGDLDAADRRTIVDFADAWDMPMPGTRAAYRAMLADAGLDVLTVEDVTGNSIGRFRTWTWLFLALNASPAGRLVRDLLRRKGLDPNAVVSQVRRAHEALPYLEHVIFVARREG